MYPLATIINIGTVVGLVSSFSDFRQYLYDHNLADAVPGNIDLLSAVGKVIKECRLNDMVNDIQDVEIVCDEHLAMFCKSFDLPLAFRKCKQDSLMMTAIEALKSGNPGAILVLEEIKMGQAQQTAGVVGILLAGSRYIHKERKGMMNIRIDAIGDNNEFFTQESFGGTEGKISDYRYIEYVNDSYSPDHRFIGWLNKNRYDYSKKMAVGNIGNELRYCDSFLLAIIRAVCCLLDKYIPRSGILLTAGKQEQYRNAGLCISYEAVPWLLNHKNGVRTSLVCTEQERQRVYMKLSEGGETVHVSSDNSKLNGPAIFIACGNGCNEMIAKVQELSEKIRFCDDIKALSCEYFETLPEPGGFDGFYFAILGNTKEELQKECASFIKNIGHCIDKNMDYKSPGGSYFTPKPLGKTGKLTFVYPGIGNAYIGMGRELFHLFPGVYKILNNYTYKLADFFHQDEVYPFDLRYNDKKQVKEINEAFLKNTICISECGISYSVLYTHVLKNYFDLYPDMAIGYSMGETSMFASLDVWDNPVALEENIHKYATFKSRLAGEMSVIKEMWHLAETDTLSWKSYSLLTSADEVSRVVARYEKVFITMINTPHNVVIAGDPGQCQGVIDEIRCTHIPFDLNLAIHCQPACAEYENMVNMHTLKLKPVLPKTKIYSTSCYMPVPLNSKTIGVSIAKTFYETVDFPRLVNTVYQNGARLFIEVGPQQTCSTWINKILKDKEHIALPMNINGMSDRVVISHTMAKLFCHNVKMSLWPYFKGKNVSYNHIAC